MHIEKWELEVVLEYLALASQWKLFIVIGEKKLKTFKISYEYSLLSAALQ